MKVYDNLYATREGGYRSQVKVQIYFITERSADYPQYLCQMCSSLGSYDIGGNSRGIIE